MYYLWKQLPAPIKSPYFLIGVSFLIWMVFFDTEDLITQHRLRYKLKNLEAEKIYYLQQIEKIQKDRAELDNNTELLEKFAREKYYMKKKTEDLYIVVEE